MPTLVAPGPQLDRYPPEADALIAEARARRRRRWLVGLLSVAVVTTGLGTWVVRAASGSPARPKTAPAAQLTASASCPSGISYGPLPVWARTGFNPPDQPIAYVLGARGDMVAVLFGGSQIPKLAHSLGAARKEFKKGLDEEHAPVVVETVKTVSPVAAVDVVEAAPTP